jgi:hypothetical protein
MSFLGFLRRKPQEAASAVAAVATTTQPIVLNASDAARIAQAKYRIGAIDRHREQHGAKGWAISATQMREFEIERAMHVLSLRAAGIEVT